MTLPRFNVKNATSMDEAADELIRSGKRAQVLAGGTDLLHGFKDRIYAEYPELVINLRSVPGFAYVQEDSDGVRIGALTTLHAVETSEVIRERYGVLAQAAHAVASPQIRNAGTIGGNICQEPRCWYYRTADNLFPCLRKGGALCNAFTGQNQYHSIFGVAHVANPPCITNCPAGNAIPSYLSRIREGDLMAAARALLETNPLPAVTGRVCPHFCEEKCNRDSFDDSVSIRSIERAIGDFILEKRDALISRPKEESGKTVAVVGAGPAGLSAAFYLRKRGHGVTIFDRLPEPGGMLRYGIPAFRLPKEVVAQQAQILVDLGVRFVLNIRIGEDGTVEQLAARFDAVFFACGAWKERPLGIEGENLAESGLGFLNRMRLDRQEPIQGTVAVVGGGNVAMDVARTLKRLGARPVVIYRRTAAEMPAIAEDVEKAEEEGIEFQFLTTPVAARKSEGGVALKCIRMRLGAPDQSGRPRPVPIEGSEFEAHFSAVMKAIGESPDTAILPDGIRLDAASSRCVGSDKLFAGGDFLTGPSTVVSAIASGRKAAESIDRVLGASSPSEEEKQLLSQPLESFGDRALCKAPPRQGAELSVAGRIAGMEREEVESLTLSQAHDEANRCHNCGCVAASPSDTAPALIALDARIKTSKRLIDAESFFAARVLRSTVLDPDELVTEIQIPALKPDTKQAFLKYRQRQSIDFPIVAVAVVLSTEGTMVSGARIALGAVAPIPLRAREAEGFLVGKELSEDVAQAAAELAVRNAVPLGKNKYKIQVTRALVRRAIMACR